MFRTPFSEVRVLVWSEAGPLKAANSDKVPDGSSESLFFDSLGPVSPKATDVTDVPDGNLEVSITLRPRLFAVCVSSRFLLFPPPYSTTVYGFADANQCFITHVVRVYPPPCGDVLQVFPRKVKQVPHH